MDFSKVVHVVNHYINTSIRKALDLVMPVDHELRTSDLLTQRRRMVRHQNATPSLFPSHMGSPRETRFGPYGS